MYRFAQLKTLKNGINAQLQMPSSLPMLLVSRWMNFAEITQNRLKPNNPMPSGSFSAVGRFSLFCFWQSSLHPIWIIIIIMINWHRIIISQKIFLKKFEKTLDNHKFLWYNKIMERGWSQWAKRKKEDRKERRSIKKICKKSWWLQL